jgi:hypothetical protein
LAPCWLVRPPPVKRHALRSNVRSSEDGPLAMSSGHPPKDHPGPTIPCGSVPSPKTPHRSLGSASRGGSECYLPLPGLPGRSLSLQGGPSQSAKMAAQGTTPAADVETFAYRDRVVGSLSEVRLTSAHLGQVFSSVMSCLRLSYENVISLQPFINCDQVSGST